MPPWLTALMQQNGQAPAQQQPPLAAAGGVSGGDMLDVFARALAGHLASQDANSGQRIQQGNNLLFGRHLGLGGQEISGANPTGSSSNPWGPGGLFAGNETNRNAEAIRVSTQPQTGYQGLVADVKGRQANETQGFATPEQGIASVAKYTQPMELDTPYSNTAASTGGVGPNPDVLAAQRAFGAAPSPTLAKRASILQQARSGAFARPQDAARIRSSPNPFAL